jgi:chorismate synthase
MAGNTFGTLFRLTTFGESHGAAIGGILDGCPAGLKIDIDSVQKELDRRRPGQSEITTQRKESDQIKFLSGIFEGITTGTPIAFVINNEDHIPADYAHLEKNYRPSHADFTYDQKYGHRDHRGGGRSSARETVSRIAGGAIAKQLLQSSGITVQAFVKQVGLVTLHENYDALDLSKTESNLVRCPDDNIAREMIRLIEACRDAGDTVGGIIQCVVKNAPTGLGEPVFDKLHAALGHAMLSINAAKGFEIGSGFNSIKYKGSELNDEFVPAGKIPVTKSNNSGGIQGGISNGMPIFFNVAFKPVSTLMRDQQTVNKSGNTVTVRGAGRHDPCVLPRAVPIVESMTALVMADFLLRNKSSKM